MQRLDDLFKHLRQHHTDQEIAAGLGNGDIDKPEWLGYSEGSDHLKVWDTDYGSIQMGFYTLWYN